MAQRVETQRPQPCRVAGARVAAPYGGAVEAATEARAEHVIVAIGVVAAIGKPRKR
jgi:hypothetical protein